MFSYFCYKKIDIIICYYYTVLCDFFLFTYFNTVKILYTLIQALTIINVKICLCRIRKLLDLIKNILICVPKMNWWCDWFGMKWGWVINDRIFIFGQTIPINKRATFLFYTYTVFRIDDFVVECFLGQSTENLFNKVQEKNRTGFKYINISLII